MPAPSFHVAGPVSVLVDDVDIGTTKSGVTISITHALEPITCDAHGSAPADFIMTGKSAVVECVALDPTLLNASNIFDMWGDIGKNEPALADIGKLATTAEKFGTLKIIERSDEYWFANKATLMDPRQLTLMSTQEVQISLTFIIIPDDDQLLFETIPAVYGA